MFRHDAGPRPFRTSVLALLIATPAAGQPPAMHVTPTFTQINQVSNHPGWRSHRP